MALIHKANIVNNVSNGQAKNGNNNYDVNFTLTEIDILIQVIAGATFPVKEIESLYKAILKLQKLRKKI